MSQPSNSDATECSAVAIEDQLDMAGDQIAIADREVGRMKTPQADGSSAPLNATEKPPARLRRNDAERRSIAATHTSVPLRIRCQIHKLRQARLTKTSRSRVEGWLAYRLAQRGVEPTLFHQVFALPTTRQRRRRITTRWHELGPSMGRCVIAAVRCAVGKPRLFRISAAKLRTCSTFAAMCAITSGRSTKRPGASTMSRHCR